MSADTTLTCRDCGQAFTFTSGEQDLYASRGFTEPGCCADCRADCRATRKSQRDASGSSYGGYGSSSSSGGGGGSYSSGGGRAAREMFTATCSSCGQPAQCHSSRAGDKPVYCSACFEQRRASGGDRGGRYGGRGR